MRPNRRMPVTGRRSPTGRDPTRRAGCQPAPTTRFSRFAACALVLFFAATAPAQPLDLPTTERARVYTSQSRQFVVVGHDAGSPHGPPSLSQVRSNYVQMAPAVVLLTCERIKSELLRELDAKDGWRGQITLMVQGMAPPDEPVRVHPQWYPTGWRFQIITPGQVEKSRLVRAVMRGLLLEMANRANPGGRLAEVPLWLQEGLAAHLFAKHGPTLVPENRTRLTFIREERAALHAVKEHLRLYDPLSVSQLNLAFLDEPEGLALETYQHTSHLFVAELLRLPGGARRIEQLLALLPSYLVPQLAFQEAFRDHFPRLLDAEQWWSVTLVSFQTRDRNLLWKEAESLAQLEAVLRQPVEVRRDTNSVPRRTAFLIQDVIDRTEFEEHSRYVIQTLQQLAYVQLNSQKDLARLIRDYRRALETYLEKRQGAVSNKSATPASAKFARDEVIESLNLLDSIRDDFRLAANPAPEPEGIERVERLLRQQGRLP